MLLYLRTYYYYSGSAKRLPRTYFAFIFLIFCTVDRLLDYKDIS
jgi:hypothetical protein